MKTSRTWPALFVLALLPACGDPFAPPPPVVKVKLETLLEEFKKNPVGVAETYRGKHLEFAGYICHVERSLFGGLAVNIVPVTREEWAARVAREEFLGPVTIYFSSELVPSLKDYPIGSRVVLRVEPPVADSRFRVNAVAVAKKRK